MAIRRNILVAAAAALGLSACAETKLAIHTAKQMVPAGPEDVEKTKGIYKIGKPYPVQGVWYYPNVDYEYKETGIASWYGTEFQGRATANGEAFDMNEVSAAHRTLPLPSVVRVVNLRNGRSLRVRINDRGPFARNRIIDLSRRAAQLLGFERDGTTTVRVEILADESRRIATLMQGGKAPSLVAAPSAPVRVVSLDEPKSRPAARPAAAVPPPPVGANVESASLPPVVTIEPVSGGRNIFVQAGSFVERDRAVRMMRKLSSIGPTLVVPAEVGAQRFYRVRVGPVRTVEAGDRLLDNVIAYGYPDARIVVDE